MRTTLIEDRDVAEARLLDAATGGFELLKRSVQSRADLEQLKADAKRWNEFNKEMLRQFFSTTQILEEYDIPRSYPILGAEESVAERTEVEKRWIKASINSIEAISEKLCLIPSSCGDRLSAGNSGATSFVDKAFVVHGHQDGTKQKVARLMEKLGVETIILEEQHDGGRTIIEKFEDHAEVGFAVVLLTPDDLGCSKAMLREPISSNKDLQARARQNVIFELGYFFGKLGRGRVAALVDGEIEIPSDLAGVMYRKIDDGGGWRFWLAKEMKKAGMDIDMNDI